MQLYIDGKMRRYNLLFAVNAGLIAVGTFARGERLLFRPSSGF